MICRLIIFLLARVFYLLVLALVFYRLALALLAYMLVLALLAFVLVLAPALPKAMRMHLLAVMFRFVVVLFVVVSLLPLVCLFLVVVVVALLPLAVVRLVVVVFLMLSLSLLLLLAAQAHRSRTTPSFSNRKKKGLRPSKPSGLEGKQDERASDRRLWSLALPKAVANNMYTYGWMVTVM